MTTQQVVLASGNAGKLRELGRILTPLGMELVSQGEFDMPQVPEDGLSFVENAIIKARAAAAHCGLPAIADDSGLEVDYLQGAPGIHSARYSGQGDEANNAKLLAALEGVDEAQRSARFQCVLVYMRHANDPTPLVCQGSWEGRILTETRGVEGFGYDPLFYVPEHDCSSAELPRDLKNAISHRAKASALLLDALR
ncbi:non-canonical purine NTP pyrophosphatase, RdgB/HAM1 family [Halioglobus japonicus]|uniref:dITP/XTP pyrophosphatase n=1 Tax=Halioglobus japonicus TaxID=930805 RepID=A0AAP8MCQ3_9GAMM|nr:RdgB/HAM1 family non-canonical purine NTP pyrophosphatase [Halioglobus japonicus]AQA17416.1 non-canonical purine NTP pyrophosphatase, RdgB/HAM1 family [Halioglobus japonicus]PLW85341.1 non-canonical purine NTP pyrophosphatase, RdgB/HAM1 family [Halioglobus japonicus]GHD22246.1 non-canonical purine NTP pyrophosphatase [Halioglobus japonicus]